MKQTSLFILLVCLLPATSCLAQSNHKYVSAGLTAYHNHDTLKAIENFDKALAGKEQFSADEYYFASRVYAAKGKASQTQTCAFNAVNNGFLDINVFKRDTTLARVIGNTQYNELLKVLRTKSSTYLSGKVILTPADKEDIMGLTRDGLRAFYFNTEKVEPMIKDLQAMLDTGSLKRTDTMSVFLNIMLGYLRDQTHDRHFYIGLNYGALIEQEVKAKTAEPVYSGGTYGFNAINTLQGNIGYIRWDNCIDGEEAYKTALAALTVLRNTRALVIDISGNGGGSGNISTFLYYYLFAKEDKRYETLLIKKCKGEPDWHRSEPPVDYHPDGVDLGDKPLYVVTSSRTFSAAEYFAFMMKELKRATLIGQNTGGGGNPINMMTRKMFVFYVPVCQITTESGKSLEGKGVAPEIVIDGENTKEEILKTVTKDLQSKGL